MAEELGFEIRDDGTLTVSRGTNQRKVEIPGSVDGIAVTAIGRSAFSNMSQVEFVSVPETVVGIEDEAFSGCTGLRYFNVEGALTTIGDRAFAGCSGMTFIDLKEGLTTIGEHAFDGCESLVIHQLPASLRELGRGAIAGCSLMRSVTVSKGGRYVGDKGGVIDTGSSRLVAVCPGVSGTFHVPGRCKQIGSDAFDGCVDVTTILIPGSVEVIESGAFTECRKLRSFGIQRGASRFRAEEDGQILYSALNERLIRVVPTYNGSTVFIPDEVSVISSGAFIGCERVNTLNLPDGLTAIEDGAFDGMPAFKCLMIPPEMSVDLPYEFVDRKGNTLGVEERAGFRFLLKNGKFLKSGKFSTESYDDEDPRTFFARHLEHMGMSETPAFSPVKVTGVSFKDVCGQERAKEELMDRVLLPQKHPELFDRYKLGTGGGVLLYGPPGTGKTLLAKAVAGELNASFYSVSTTDIYNKWLGESESRIRSLFETARGNTPSVIFLDDFDAIGAKRDEDSKDWRSGIITQLLVEMQGVTGDNKGVLVMAATNRPQDIDNALKRPGRFDVEIACDLPNLQAREDMIRRRMAGVPHSRIGYRRLAEATEGFNGADVDRLVNVAKLTRLKACARGAPENVTMKDFESALSTVESSVNPEDTRNTEEYSRTGTVSSRRPVSAEEEYRPSTAKRDDPSYR